MTRNAPRFKSAHNSKYDQIPAGAIAMARRAGIEGRLAAVLDPNRRRGAASTARMIGAVLIMLGVVAPLAAIRARAQTPAGGQAPVSRPAAGVAASNDSPIGSHPTASVQVKFVGPDGNPAVGLTVSVKSIWLGGAGSGSVWNSPEASRASSRVTDASGACTFLLPRESQTLFIIDDLRFAQIPQGTRVRTGAGETAEPVTIQLQPAATISGKITYGPTGQAAAGIRVLALASTRARSSGRGETVTDERGEFRMTQLSPGEYDVKLSWPRPQWTAAPLMHVKVAEGQNVVGQNLILVRGGIISGRVYRGDTGQGMKDADVVARDVILRETDDFAQTDAEGRYSLRVPPGTSRVFINNSPIEGYEGFGDSHAREVTIADGETVTRDFMLTPGPGRPVSGKVVDADGKPLAGVYVMAQSPDEETQPSSSATTDAKGNFRFAAVAPETSLHASRPPAELLPPRIVKGGETDITLQLLVQKPATVTATVVDANNAPVANARIELVTSSGSTGFGKPDAAATDTSGHFTLAGLLPGPRYSIWVTAPGFGITQVPIELKPGAAQADLGIIRLDRTTARIAGRVLDAQGHPVAKARVSINGTRTAARETQTDADGRFSFKVIEGASALIYLRDKEGKPGKAQRVQAGDTNIEL